MAEMPSHTWEKLKAIEVWMRETEEAVSSQDSYKEDALSPEGIDLILEYFMEVLEADLGKKPLLVMVKSVTLFLRVTKNLDSKKEKLVILLDALLISVLRADVSERVAKTCIDEANIILESCMEDENSREHIIGGFTQRILNLVTDVNIAFWVRCSLLKSFNKSLLLAPTELRTEVFKELSQDFESLVDSLYSCGDFDMQATIVETLLRFTTKSARSQLSNNWFPNYVKLQALFIGIKDFEVDCRKFLNHFNEGLGEQGKVFSYKMLNCVVEGQTLVKPADMSDFWIDFNLGSNSLSVYYALNDEQDSSWKKFSLNRSQVAKIQARWIQGRCRWTLLIFSSADLKEADVILEFSQPKSIPDKIKSIFGPALVADKHSISTGVLSVAPKNPSSAVSKARLNASDDPGMKTSVAKGFLFKTGKTDSRTSFQALSSSQDQSSLPCAQPPPLAKKTSVKKPSSSIPQKLVNQVKKVSRMSMTGSLKLTKKPKSRSIKAKSPKMKTKPSPQTQKRPKPFGKVVDAKKDLPSSIQANEDKDDESMGTIIKSQESSSGGTMKRKSKSMANSKIADIKDIESKGSNESLLRDVPTEAAAADETKSTKVDRPRVSSPTSKVEPIAGKRANLPLVDNKGVADILPETDFDEKDLKKNRLSYSGRRIRAQRKALKRKSENPDIPVVKKKICFDDHSEAKVNQEGESERKKPISANDTENTTASSKKDAGISRQGAKSLLSDWDEIFDEPPQDKDLSESIHVVADKKANDQIKFDKDSAPETTKDSVPKPQIDQTSSDVVISQQNDPEPIVDNIPAQSADVIKGQDVDRPKSRSILANGCGSGGEPSKKKRRSSKVLFSETVLDSEADQVLVSDNNELRPDVIPSYDQTYKRVESKQINKPGDMSKPSKVDPADCSSTLNPSKKFFKEKGEETAHDFPKPSISKPKRTYQRRPSGPSQSVTKSTEDPYSFCSKPAPKGKRSSYLQQRRRVTASSKRRSDKLFSDEEGGDSVKGSPEKSFADTGLRISDVGEMGDTGPEESVNLTRERETSKYASRRKSTNKDISKHTLVMLEHMSGMLKAVACMSEGLSKKVLSDISFFIVQQSDHLVLE